MILPLHSYVPKFLVADSPKFSLPTNVLSVLLLCSLPKFIVKTLCYIQYTIHSCKAILAVHNHSMYIVTGCV